MTSSNIVLGNSYTLLDSGDGLKIEQFGEVITLRPYKRACWRLARPLHYWRKRASLSFSEKGTWKHLGDTPSTWDITTNVGTMSLRTQRSNQLGLFPEHASYLPELAPRIAHNNVLNLFGYTGLATLFALHHGAQSVTHVDLSESCLSWLKANLAHNTYEGKVHLIKDDALKYLERTTRRERTFDLIIADPPAFSRPGKKCSWTIEQILPQLMRLMSQCLAPNGTLVISSHAPEYDHCVLSNVLRQEWQHHQPAQIIHAQDLVVQEHERGFLLPHGYVVVVTAASGGVNESVSSS